MQVSDKTIKNTVSEPWIKYREWMPVSWIPDKARGEFTNPHANISVDIFRFTRQQIRDYLTMMSQFGFNGIQLADTCCMWGMSGSMEAYHEKLQLIAETAHDIGLNVTLWVWASCFTWSGWHDAEAAYKPKPGWSAYEDEDVRRFFEKYYDIYSTMAPFADRLIGHFFDPGFLEDVDDVFAYMKLLESKFKDRNPDIKLGIDSWGAPDEFIEKMTRSGLNEYTLMEMTFPPMWPEGSRKKFRETALKYGLKVGIWGWDTCEYETDQFPAMYVNGHVIKSVYSNIRNEAERVMTPEYWSEMEASHLVNIYSMYVAGQLLIDPDRDPDQLLEEISEGIWGPVNGKKVLDALMLIQEVRSGTSWETYWWSEKKYQLGTDDPRKDAERAEKALNELARMKPDGQHVCRFTLPVTPRHLVELILPHLEQIRLYAIFRTKAEDIEKAISSGVAKEEITEMIQEAWEPIPEFDTWIGTFRQIEQRSQSKKVDELCKKIGIDMPWKPWHAFLNLARITERMQHDQKTSAERMRFDDQYYSTSGYGYSEAETKYLVGMLQQQGLVTDNGDKSYSLANWKDYAIMEWQQ